MDGFLISGERDYVSEVFDALSLQVRTKSVVFGITPVYFVLSIVKVLSFLALLTVMRY